MRLFMMSMIIQKLIPARFLLMTAHVVITVCIIWSRDMNVIAGLPDKYSPDDYSRKDFDINCSLCIHVDFGCLHLRRVVVQRLLVHMGVLLCPAGRGRTGSRFENTAATFRFLDHALL
ncbi:transmembrane protein 107 [Trichinella spiralis]|uniref:transmembrane protein 107 n=1 Tax=Trichinella spiralis TaxID=6334 RepID=UPI0001EFE8A1|nr:transmembrane protein 107 [Trichinella spiralis]